MYWRHKLGNDRWIVDVLRGKRNGYFVEAGAVDGMRGSATYALETAYDWTGICVEPHQGAYASLRQNRSCVCDPRCLADKSCTVEFIQVHDARDPPYSGIRENLEEFKRPYWGSGRAVPIPAVSLLQLLREHNAPKQIDYLALDTEGNELRILGAFDFTEYSITAISVEGDGCNELLLAKGFRKVANPHTDETYEHYFLRCSDENSR